MADCAPRRELKRREKARAKDAKKAEKAAAQPEQPSKKKEDAAGAGPSMDDLNPNVCDLLAFLALHAETSD